MLRPFRRKRKASLGLSADDLLNLVLIGADIVITFTDN
jgi:hypothetical protein